MLPNDPPRPDLKWRRSSTGEAMSTLEQTIYSGPAAALYAAAHYLSHDRRQLAAIATELEGANG